MSYQNHVLRKMHCNRFLSVHYNVRFIFLCICKRTTDSTLEQHFQYWTLYIELLKMINVKDTFQYERELLEFEHEHVDGWTDNELDNQTKILNEKQNQIKINTLI